MLENTKQELREVMGDADVKKKVKLPAEVLIEKKKNDKEPIDDDVTTKVV